MIEEIVKEKTSADHLLYVSLKYTKTCDVILNLISRWKSLIDVCFDSLIKTDVEKGIIKAPSSPREKIEIIRKNYSKSKPISDIIPLYLFFKRIPELSKTREGEFRKNVNLKVIDQGKVININMDKLGEYSEIVETFFFEVKRLLSTKK